jgi:flagellar hook protein FlgE
MLTSLYTGVSGMDANGTGLSVVGDNIANMNTTGFKSSRASFGDVLSQTLTGAGSNQVGRGVAVSSVSAQHIQGAFESTGNNLDMAVDGDGFFVVKSGAIQYYTRDGQFSPDKDGYIVNNEGYRVQGFLADSSGNITGSVGDLNINSQQSQASATTSASVSVNLNAEDKDFGGDTFTLGLNNDTPTNYSESTTMKIYDSLGAAHDITLYFVKTGIGTWNVHYVHTDPLDATKLVDDSAAAPQTLTFDTDGSMIDDGSTTAISFDFGAQTVTPQDVTFNFGNGTGETPPGTGFDGTTQFASPFSVTQLTQDGFGSGSVTSVTISEDGHITASFTNGQSRIIGQMALARFLAPSDLAKLGRNLYNETFDSGQPIISKPETSGNGRVLSKTLELSNVDLAQEFVKLISYQRAFQANSRVITTTDQLMQDLISVVR